MKTNKRGQFWYADFMVAVLIMMVIGLLFVATIRDLTSRNEIIKELVLDASDISTVLLSEGSGDRFDWGLGKGTVGLLTDYKFDINKMDNLNTLNYNQQKIMFGTFNNIWIYLSDKQGNIKESNNLNIQRELNFFINDISDLGEHADNIVHIKRFVFYDENQDGKGDIHILGVVVWN